MPRKVSLLFIFGLLLQYRVPMTKIQSYLNISWSSSRVNFWTTSCYKSQSPTIVYAKTFFTCTSASLGLFSWHSSQNIESCLLQKPVKHVTESCGCTVCYSVTLFFIESHANTTCRIRSPKIIANSLQPQTEDALLFMYGKLTIKRRTLQAGNVFESTQPWWLTCRLGSERTIRLS